MNACTHEIESKVQETLCCHHCLIAGHCEGIHVVKATGVILSTCPQEQARQFILNIVDLIFQGKPNVFLVPWNYELVVLKVGEQDVRLMIEYLEIEDVLLIKDLFDSVNDHVSWNLAVHDLLVVRLNQAIHHLRLLSRWHNMLEMTVVS